MWVCTGTSISRQFIEFYSLYYHSNRSHCHRMPSVPVQKLLLLLFYSIDFITLAPKCVMQIMCIHSFLSGAESMLSLTCISYDCWNPFLSSTQQGTVHMQFASTACNFRIVFAAVYHHFKRFNHFNII